MNKIDGLAKTIRQLLSGSKYSVDYYQREYKWEITQVAELLDDLANKFKESYEEDHERSAVESYGHYFLGSVIISNKDGQKFIIDGQQRLTTLTLLLIYLHNLQRNRDAKVPIAELIFSEKYSKRSFNIDVPERTPCMEALFNSGKFEENGSSESVRNIAARYMDIEELFPADLRGKVLPYYIDWLIENVHLVEITAYSDEDAYTIFETMNDRGLSLSPTEMLKGYLLTNIVDPDQRQNASRTWKERITRLHELGKDEDADCLKAWLRSQYANTIRERKRDAKPQDFDKIGTEFHRWLKDNEKELGLRTSSEFARFIECDFAFYSRQYARLREASNKLVAGLEPVFYNAQNNFTLQYPLLLAPLAPSDPEEQITRKLGLVASYLDILIARRIWNWRSIDYSTMQYAMFLTMREIRGRNVAELADSLTKRLAIDDDKFEKNDRFRLHGTNGRQIHRLLARIVDFTETRSGMSSRYAEYATRSGKRGYEIEHVWANHPERHKDEFAHSQDFEEYRNRIGGLLLLPKSFNASYGDLPYEQKLQHYFSQNLLARSLHPHCYEHNPGFRKFLEETRLAFKAHPHFRRVDLDARQDLYRAIAERIWSPARLTEYAQAP